MDHPKRFFRRRWVWLTALAVIAVAAPLLARWVLTRPAMLESIAQTALSQVLGGPVTIESATWLGSGQVKLTGVVLSIDGVPDSETTIASVKQLTVHLDLWEALLGGHGIESIRAVGGELNLLEAQGRSGWVNLANLHPSWSGSSQRRSGSLPAIELIDLRVTLGLLTDEGVVHRGARSVDGSLQMVDAEGEEWAFDLIGAEDGEDLAGSPWTLTGTIVPETGTVTAHVDSIEIDDGLRAMLPMAVVRQWAAMNPSGRVASIDLEWVIGTSPVLEVQLDHAALTLPVQGSNIWARFHDGEVRQAVSQPHLVLDAGSMVFDGAGVHLQNVVGSVAGPPGTGTPLTFELEFTAGGIDGWQWDQRSQWAAELAAAAPFSLSLRTDSFEVTSGPHGIDIPVIVATVLEIFPVSTATLSTEVTINRSAPEIDPDGRPIPAGTTFHGRVLVDDARGYLAAFPYPLEDVSAYVEFSEDRVEIVRATGRGRRFGSTSVTGTIPLDETASGMTLRVELVDVRLDEEFRAALSGVTGSIYDELFDIDAWQAIDFTEAEQAGLVMELGGSIDATLDIIRPAGVDPATVYTGQFDFDHLGMVWSGFTYPLLLGPGTIQLTREGVTLGEVGAEAKGIELTTMTGATGHATGSFAFDDSGESLVCDLGVAVQGDRVNPDLQRALADILVRHGHDAVGRGVKHLKATGALDYQGHVTTDGQDAIEASFTVEFQEGELLADAAALETLWPSALPSMQDIVLDHLRGRLSLTTTGIEIQEVTGKVAGGRFVMAGDPSRQAGAIWRGNVTIDERLLQAMESFLSAEEMALLRDWKIRGDVAIEAHMVIDDDAITIGNLVIDPRRVMIEREGVEIEVTGRGGDLLVTDGEVLLRSLVVGIGDPGKMADLHLTFDGMLEIGSELAGEVDFSGYGRVHSPVVVAMVGETVGEALSAIEFDDGHGTIVDSARVVFGPDRKEEMAFFVRLAVDDASMNVGAVVSEIDGVFSITTGYSKDASHFQMRVIADSIDVVGLTVDDVVAQVVLDADRHRIVVEELHGTLSGGDVVATAWSGVDDHRQWVFRAEIAGADVVALTSDQPQPPGGRIVARLALSGLRGDPSSQRGRGAVRIMGGKIADVPAALALVQVIQLTTPFVKPLDYADVRFYVEGENAVLESIVLESTLGDAVPLQLLGDGTLSLSDLELDVHFRSRSGWLVLREIIGLLGDQLFCLHLHGPVDEPTVEIVPLPGLRRSPL